MGIVVVVPFMGIVVEPVVGMVLPSDVDGEDEFPPPLPEQPARANASRMTRMARAMAVQDQEEGISTMAHVLEAQGTPGHSGTSIPSRGGSLGRS
jgi:hypothetical protein